MIIAMICSHGQLWTSSPFFLHHPIPLHCMSNSSDEATEEENRARKATKTVGAASTRSYRSLDASRNNCKANYKHLNDFHNWNTTPSSWSDWNNHRRLITGWDPESNGAFRWQKFISSTSAHCRCQWRASTFKEHTTWRQWKNEITNQGETSMSFSVCVRDHNDNNPSKVEMACPSKSWMPIMKNKIWQS